MSISSKRMRHFAEHDCIFTNGAAFLTKSATIPIEISHMIFSDQTKTKLRPAESGAGRKRMGGQIRCLK